MDIKIRGVSEDIISFLNQKAKEKGMSREALLREQLKLIALDDEIKVIKEREEIMVNNLLKVIELNTKVMKAFLKNSCVSFEEVIEND